MDVLDDICETTSSVVLEYKSESFNGKYNCVEASFVCGSEIISSSVSGITRIVVDGDSISLSEF